MLKTFIIVQNRWFDAIHKKTSRHKFILGQRSPHIPGWCIRKWTYEISFINKLWMWIYCNNNPNNIINIHLSSKTCDQNTGGDLAYAEVLSFVVFWCPLSLLFTIRIDSPLLLIRLWWVDNTSFIYVSKKLESLLYEDKWPLCCEANDRCPILQRHIGKIKIIQKMLFLQ